MPKVIKLSNPFTNVCWVSVLNNIFCAATNFGCIDSFLLPNSRNEEMMGDGFGATAAGLFLNSKRLLSTSCNKQGHAAAAAFFRHGVI